MREIKALTSIIFFNHIQGTHLVSCIRDLIGYEQSNITISLQEPISLEFQVVSVPRFPSGAPKVPITSGTLFNPKAA